MRLREIANAFAIIVIGVAVVQWLDHPLGVNQPELLPLDRQVEPIEFEAVPLPSIISQLSQTWGIAIDIDPQATLDLAYDPVTISIPKGTIAKALSTLKGARDDLAYYADRRGVHITTIGHLPLTVRVYDVRDLYGRMIEAYPASNRPRSPQRIPVFNGAVNLAPLPSVVPTTAPAAQRTIEQVQMDRIVNVIDDTITPDLWIENGGQVASIKGSGGVLIVAHTADGQRQIQALLTSLRRASADKWNPDTFALDKK